MLLAAAALALGPSLAAPPTDLTAQIAAILARSEEAGVEELGRELGALGPSAVPHLIDALVDGFLPGERGSALDDVRRAALVAGIAERPTAWRRPFDALVERDPRPAARLAALEVMAACGTGASFDLAILAATGVLPEDAAVPRALEAALARVLARDVGAHAQVPALVASAAPELGAPLVRGTAASEHPQALDALVRVAELRPDLELVILPAIGRIATIRPDVDVGPARALVRRSLARSDPQVLREAAAAAARVRDHDAIERLLELLDHEHRGTRENAFWALETLTGLALSRRPERWRAWYAGERAWWDETAAGVLATLTSEDLGAVFHALRELGARRMHRDRILSAVAPLLRHESPTLRRQALSVAAGLSDRRDAALLVPCLLDESDEIALTAWRTLERITGLELPRDAAAWQRALAPAGARGG